MKKCFVILCLLLLLLPLPGMVLAGGDWLSPDREERVTEGMTFRSEMIRLHARLCRLLGMSGSDQVALGRDGFYFMASTLPTSEGESAPSDDQIDAVARQLKRWQEDLQARGIAMIFLCAPNKATILPDKLPYYARAAEKESAVARLQKKLDRLQVAYVDAYGLLRQEGENLYHRTDTHWNDEGACRVYRALMEALPAVPWERYDTAEKNAVQRVGDLTELICPSGGETEEVQERLIPRTYRTQGLMRTVMDMRIETACSRNDLQVVMLRDSFANALFPYLANNVGRLTLIRSNQLDMESVPQGTQAVIIEIAERSLLHLLPPAQ